MKTNQPVLISILLTSAVVGCKQTDNKVCHQPAPPQYEAVYDRSTAPLQIEIEQSLQHPANLKLSQIASQLEYYTVGDARFPVTQAIEIPDNNAFITFNYPRIYYRKQDVPSKRYGFKALAYKWNNGMNKVNLFYDKKTTRMYCALSGLDQNNKEEKAPYIGELPPLDTLLKIQNYIFPEDITTRYPLHLTHDRLLGFSSSGYTLCHYEGDAGEPNGIITFNLQGDTLCKFILKEPASAAKRWQTDSIPSFQTFFWNNEQSQMTFTIPFCDTIYRLLDSRTISTLYALNLGEKSISGDQLTQPVANGKIWLRTCYENPKSVCIGLRQKGAPEITNWLGHTDEYKPALTHRIVYLKEDRKTYALPRNSGGFINDIDDGLAFWPDGQTDDCLYMIRTVTEMRETVKRTGSARQQELLRFLDNPQVHERDYVMIVARIK